MICLKVKLKNGVTIEEVIGLSCTEDGLLVERESADRHVHADLIDQIEVVRL